MVKMRMSNKNTFNNFISNKRKDIWTIANIYQPNFRSIWIREDICIGSKYRINYSIYFKKRHSINMTKIFNL